MNGCHPSTPMRFRTLNVYWVSSSIAKDAGKMFSSFYYPRKYLTNSAMLYIYKSQIRRSIVSISALIEFKIVYTFSSRKIQPSLCSLFRRDATLQAYRYSVAMEMATAQMCPILQFNHFRNLLLGQPSTYMESNHTHFLQIPKFKEKILLFFHKNYQFVSYAPVWMLP